MTTELQIAKKLWKESNEDMIHKTFFEKDKMQQHLADCKRWLEWFNKGCGIHRLRPLPIKGFGSLAEHLTNKISDLQETIKYYEEKGIK